MVIDSKSNKIIAYAKKIQSKKYSQEFGECFLETEKIILERIADIKTILICDKFASKFSFVKNFTGNIYYISESICEYLSESSNPSAIFAFIKIPQKQVDKGNFLVLDNIQDPNNIGAIIRSARAFGFNNIFAVNCAYPFCYKSIRSSMGYVFDVNYKSFAKDEFISFAKENNLKIICADMNGENIQNYNKGQTKSAVGICIGNEGHGISEEIKNLCFKTVSIPMQNNVESLNASVSASIIMFHINNSSK